jgi:threonylcarbamoyladenosine tRNA methylthiotransferase MtaB
MKISFLTYGCKVNQYETGLIRQMMLAGGLTEAADLGGADIYLVNTCTVTAKIDSEISRKIKQLKSKPGARVILTGCLAQRGGPDVEKLGADWIITNGSKLDPDSYPAEIFPLKTPAREKVLSEFSGRNKAFVKIEDGCDRFCAYCTVPLVRGSDIRSRDVSEIIYEIEKLTAAGFSEIIMTGVNLGRFGAGKGDKTALYGLLKQITLLKGGFRVRLSSMSPADLDDGVILLAADNPERICPHFHLSMQSGDDAVLKRMNRRYDTKLYRDKAEFIALKIKLPGITTDVIAGFPGETGAEFENTLAFINDIPLTRLHVFPYSDRPGTKATQMSGKVDEAVKKERVKKLLRAAEKKEYDFAVKNTGFVRTALIEDPNKNNELFGYTENYIRVLINDTPAARAKVNGLATVRIIAATASCVKAEPVRE